MAAHLSRPRTDEEGLDDLAPLWAELHGHHREVSAYQRLVEDVASSQARRLEWYRRLLAQNAAYVTATDDRGRLIGHVMVAVEERLDDTFEVTGGMAEVVTLIVTRDQRSTGVGEALMQAAERIAHDRGFDTMKIAVMHGNARAQNFYVAHGYSVGEHVLYRRLADR
jgi:GNAT superfamily N-acetyltransferase